MPPPNISPALLKRLKGLILEIRKNFGSGSADPIFGNSLYDLFADIEYHFPTMGR